MALERQAPVNMMNTVDDPVTGFHELAERGPVLAGTSFDGNPVWFITGHDAVREVLSDRRFVTNAAAVPGRHTDDLRDYMVATLGIPPDIAVYMTGTILTVDGADHSRLRKLSSRAFTMRRIVALRPRMEQIASDLLDSLSGRADIIDDFAYPLPVTVICDLVGVPEEFRPAWLRFNVAIATLDPRTVPVAAREMIDHCHQLAVLRRDNPADDLVSALVAARYDDGDKLTEVELVTMLITLIINGHETTAHLISNSVLALLNHPEQLDLLRRDPTLWPNAIQELMRWTGPVTSTGLRYATEDVEVAGVTIKAGQAVQAILGAANLDSKEFPDAERLDVTRRPAARGEAHVGFGHGPHYCFGAALARLEAEVALSALFERFPRIALSTQPLWMPRPGMRWLASLPVTLD